MNVAKPTAQWTVEIRQYNKDSGAYIRNFSVQVSANNEDLAKAAALDQVAKWAVGDFGVNIPPGDLYSGVQRPYIRYGVAGARNRIVSVKRTG